MTVRDALAATVLAVALAPVPARAVPCEPLTLEQAYAAQAALPLPFVVLQGTFTPAFDRFSEFDRFRFALQFDGARLDPDGSSAPMSAVVIVDGRCARHDCGPLRGPGEEQIALALFDDGGLRIEVLPCGTFPANATPATRARVDACLAGACG